MDNETLTIKDINIMYNLFVYYANKGVFQLEEYKSVSEVSMKLKDFLVDVKDNKRDPVNEPIDLQMNELNFVNAMLKICSNRQATDVDEMEVVFNIRKKLNNLTQTTTSESKFETVHEDETKEE